MQIDRRQRDRQTDRRIVISPTINISMMLEQNLFPSHNKNRDGVGGWRNRDRRNLAGHLLVSQNNESAPHSLSDPGKK